MSTAEANARQITDAILALPPVSQRRLIAIAGPPAAGKSTVAALVHAYLNAEGCPTGLVAMDGFHLDNAELDARDLLARKGAPNTFDLKGFAQSLRRLATQACVKIPMFDRGLDKTLPDAARVEAHEQHVVVEGNYLLLDAEGWRELAPFWAFSVFLEEDLQDLETRLMKRWRGYGLAEAEAAQKAALNDLPNAKLVLQRRLPSTMTLNG